MALLSRERYSEVDIIVCDATPEGDISAPTGSMALSTEGASYTKVSGAGNTGWRDGSAVLTGNTIWVDAVNGDDATGAVGRQDLPFLTLNAAQSVGSAGDTVVVRPGTYDERVVLNDANWHFENGAILHYTGTSTGMMFGDDLVSAATCRVTGWGVFHHEGTPDTEDPTPNSGPYNGVVGFCNTRTNIYFEGLDVVGDQSVDLGAGGFVIDCGTIVFNIKRSLTSSIYDALLTAGEVDGNSVVSGQINSITTTVDADNAIEAPSGGTVGNIKVGRIVHGNTDVLSINGIGRNLTIECDSVSGGGVRVSAGILRNCTISLEDTGGDPLGETLILGQESGVVGKIVNCRVIQTKASTPAVSLNANATQIESCVLVAGAGATESIIPGSATDVTCFNSYANVAVEGTVVVSGSLTVGAYVQ